MNTQGGHWRMVAAMSLSGTIGLFVLSSGQSPLTVVFYRCLIGGSTLLAWLSWQQGWRPLNRGSSACLLLGAISLILNWLCLFTAYRLSSISIATVVYHVQPFLLLMLASLIQREQPDWHKLPLLGVALLGVIMTAGIDWQHRQAASLQGVSLALLAALLYALATLATKRLHGVPPAQLAGLQLILGAIVLAPMSHLTHQAASWQPWASLLILGVIHTGLMYNLMYTAFQRLPTGTIATLSFIYPLVALGVDLLYFHTRLSGIQLCGMLLILIAVVANQRGWSTKSLRWRLLGNGR